MKYQRTLTNVIPRPGRLGWALAGLLLLGIAASSSGQVLSPSSRHFGLSYAEWSAKWWQFNLGQSTDTLEVVSSGEGPGRRVRFLDSPGASIATNDVVIHPGTFLFFPILAEWMDNGACSPSNTLTFGSLTAAELAAANAESWSGAPVTVTTCTIDGVPVDGLSDPQTTIYLIVSPPFSYTTAEEDNVLAALGGETCVPGGLTVYPAEAEGVYLMLAPLSPGNHSIHTVGVVGPVETPFFVQDVIYDITVAPR